jgi:hypothetical protein
MGCSVGIGPLVNGSNDWLQGSSGDDMIIAGTDGDWGVAAERTPPVFNNVTESMTICGVFRGCKPKPPKIPTAVSGRG